MITPYCTDGWMRENVANVFDNKTSNTQEIKYLQCLKREYSLLINIPGKHLTNVLGKSFLAIGEIILSFFVVAQDGLTESWQQKPSHV